MPTTTPVPVTAVQTTSQIKQRLAILATFREEDKTNLTVNYRSSYQYKIQLALDLASTIKQLSQKLGRPLHLLDAGCGQGFAIDDYLSDPSLSEHLDLCTGASLHYFSHIHHLVEKHQQRFQYVYGKVQDYLAPLQAKFDLILDVCGAYLYSVDRIALLRLYHQALKPEGFAQICMHDFKDNILLLDGAQKKSFIEILCREYPETFEVRSTTFTNSLTNKNMTNYILTVRKMTSQFPVPFCEVKEFTSCITGALAEKVPLEEEFAAYQRGNAVAPGQVIFQTPPQNFPADPPVSATPCCSLM